MVFRENYRKRERENKEESIKFHHRNDIHPFDSALFTFSKNQAMLRERESVGIKIKLFIHAWVMHTHIYTHKFLLAENKDLFYLCIHSLHSLRRKIGQNARIKKRQLKNRRCEWIGFFPSKWYVLIWMF